MYLNLRVAEKRKEKITNFYLSFLNMMTTMLLAIKLLHESKGLTKQNLLSYYFIYD